MEEQRRKKILTEVPRGKVVVFRKHEPILIDKSLLNWRKRNRRQAKKLKEQAKKVAQYKRIADEEMEKLGLQIINPFAPKDEK